MDNHCLCRLRDVYRAIINFEYKLEKTTGLNINEAMLLCLLSDGEERLSGQIAEQLDLTRSNASKVIAALEKKAYIRRMTCKEDSRCQKFHITKKGNEMLESIHCDSVQVPEELARLGITMGQTAE